MKPIYLDYNATTPMLPEVIDAMTQCGFGNSSSDHDYGETAAVAIAHARQQVADAVGCQTEEIIWTSGATESNNLALFGAARFYARRGRHIVTLATEHKAVLDVCQQLEREGFTVTILTPMSNGLVTIEQVRAALRPDTILVSIMYANSEIGVIQNLQNIGQLVRAKGALMHVDAAQCVGKISVDLKNLPVDLMSFSAHKAYGPKGIGALFVRHQPRVRLQPLQYGGGQEQGLRAGTLPTPLIVGMGLAFELAKSKLDSEAPRQRELIARLWSGIRDLPGIQRNGDSTSCLPNTLNISVAGVNGAALHYALRALALSTTSACASSSLQPSHVLTAIGLPPQLAHASLRFSIGRMTTTDEIDRAITIVREQVLRLRELAP